MKRQSQLLLQVLSLLIAALTASCSWAQANDAGKPDEPPTWVELGENGEIIARQLLEYSGKGKAPSCPAIKIKGAPNPPTRTQQRGSPSKDFEVVVCEAVIPNGATSAAIGSIQLPLPKNSLNKMVLIGDTGCKGDATGTGLKVTPMEDPDDSEEDGAAGKAKKAQDCKSEWPFSTIAKKAAAQGPDLIVHVGDYVYVKEENWTQWHYQFFKPARDLLLAAPWIFARGNHEICKYHGAGFFYLLDPREGTSCPSDNSDPYLAKMAGKQFLVMDSSGADCDYTPGGKDCDNNNQYEQEVTTWTGLFNQAKSLMGSGNAFMLTHRPLWGIKWLKEKNPGDGYCNDKDKDDKDKGKDKKHLFVINAVMQVAYQNSGISGINMVLSGHIHNFQLITYTPVSGIDPQPQLVIGDSGVEMSTPPPSPMDTCKVRAQNGYLSLSNFWGQKEFGFGVLKGDGTEFTLYLKSGKPGLRCTIASHEAECPSK